MATEPWALELSGPMNGLAHFAEVVPYGVMIERVEVLGPDEVQLECRIDDRIRVPATTAGALRLALAWPRDELGAYLEAVWAAAQGQRTPLWPAEPLEWRASMASTVIVIARGGTCALTGLRFAGRRCPPLERPWMQAVSFKERVATAQFERDRKRRHPEGSGD